MSESPIYIKVKVPVDVLGWKVILAKPTGYTCYWRSGSKSSYKCPMSKRAVQDQIQEGRVVQIEPAEAALLFGEI